MNLLRQRLIRKRLVLAIAVTMFAASGMASAGARSGDQTTFSSSFEPTTRTSVNVVCQEHDQCSAEATATVSGLMQTKATAPLPWMRPYAYASVVARVPITSTRAANAQLTFTVETSRSSGTSPWGDALTEYTIGLGATNETTCSNGLWTTGYVDKDLGVLEPGSYTFTSHIRCSDGSRFQGAVVGWVSQETSVFSDFGFLSSASATTTVLPVAVAKERER